MEDREYHDYNNREVRIGEDVLQLTDGFCGRVISWTAGGNPRIVPWNNYNHSTEGKGFGRPASRAFAITGRWVVLRPLEGEVPSE